MAQRGVPQGQARHSRRLIQFFQVRSRAKIQAPVPAAPPIPGARLRRLSQLAH